MRGFAPYSHWLITSTAASNIVIAQAFWLRCLSLGSNTKRKRLPKTAVRVKSGYSAGAKSITKNKIEDKAMSAVRKTPRGSKARLTRRYFDNESVPNLCRAIVTLIP